jgi:hypothetical protein
MGINSKSNVSFSLELHSRDHIKRVSLPDGSGDRLMIEGSLGCLTVIEMVEDILLEINGINGKMRIGVTRRELEHVLNKKPCGKDAEIEKMGNK